MSGEGNPSTITTSVTTSSSQEMEELAVGLGALEIREALPRQKVMQAIRSIQMDIRRFELIVPIELSKMLFEMEPTDGEQNKGKEKMVQSEDLRFVKDLFDEIGYIELYIDELQQEYEERPPEEEKVLMHLTEIQGYKVLMKSLMMSMKKFLNDQWLANEDHYKDTISEAKSIVPVLPPLPHFEVSQIQRKMKTEGGSSSSSDTESTSSGCSDMEELEELCSFEGPYWEALTAPTKVLATDDEEEEMVMDASILLGSDLNANSIITKFDAFEGSTTGTSRDFLQNLPLIYVCPNHKCAICCAGFPLKDRCARLPCLHHFHVTCILEWLLKKTTCPMCRHELPRR